MTSMEEALDFSMKKPIAHSPVLQIASPQSSEGSRQSPSSTTPAAGPTCPSSSAMSAAGLFFPGNFGQSPFFSCAGGGFQPFLKPKSLCPTPPFGLGLGIPGGPGYAGLPDPFSPPAAAPWLPPSTPSMLGSIPDPAFFPTASLALSSIHRRRRSETLHSGSSDSGGLRSGSPTHKRPTQGVPEEKKDEMYWERRRKNNEAAKRSRDTRRAKEEEIAMRAAILEQENLKLRAQVAVLKNETAKLHFMLFSQASSSGSANTAATPSQNTATNQQILA